MSSSSSTPSRGVHFTCERVGHTFKGERGNVEALRDISLTVHEHEFVCVVGPSGCG
jgi:NitT/TauT family transport system ATP-binding protein